MIHMTCLIHLCAMIDSYLCHDSFLRTGITRSHHLHVWRISFMCAPHTIHMTCLIHLCAMTDSYVCHDSFWRTDITQSCHLHMWHISFIRVPWLIHMTCLIHTCAMIDSCVCHGSFLCAGISGPIIPECQFVCGYDVPCVPWRTHICTTTHLQWHYRCHHSRMPIHLRSSAPSPVMEFFFQKLARDSSYHIKSL